GLKLKIDSLATLIAGGITFDSPDLNTSKSCCDFNLIPEFELYADKDDMNYDQDIIRLIGEKAYNLDPDISAIYYKGVTAGKIDSINYDPKKDITYIDIKLKKSFSTFVEKKAYFWIVEPKLTLSGISGLDAIAKGPYIALIPHKGSVNKNNQFPLHVMPPKSDGTSIGLRAKDIGALRVGSSIFYNDIEAGYINAITLASDKKGLYLDAVIENEYSKLLNDSSLFYLRNALETDISLSQIKIKAKSLKSMIQGGIAFETDNLKAPRQKKNFTLHDSFLDTQKTRYLNNGGKRFTLRTQNSHSLKKGVLVYYKHFKAGEVLSVEYNEKTDNIDIEVYIEKRFASKINASTHFYNASGINVSLDFPNVNVDMQSLQSLLSGGLSFITLDTTKQGNIPKEFRLYDDYKDASDESYKAMLHLDSAMNLSVGSKILHKGIVIGKVSEISLMPQGVEVLMSIEKLYTYLMRADSVISISKFKLGLDGVKNADAIISGPSLHVSFGTSKLLGKHYILKNILSHKNQLREGLRVAVSAARRSSLKVGSPVLYRQIQIGDIEEYRLSDDATQVEFSLFIDPCYAHLVRNNSYFYNASAIGIDIDLGGIKVKTETLETMMAGGIILVTPTEFKDEAKEMQIFKLHDEAQEEWMHWHPKSSSSNPMCQ
ncbi:MAG: MlaD family protein, partial [Campylobacterota bacterium]|nr:MlaD family protein [Campylobacterota bacterium]